MIVGHRIPWQLRDDGILKSAMTIIAKDVGIVMDEARLHSFPAPLCSVAEQVFTAALGAGLAREDDGNIVKLWQRFGVPHEYEQGTEEEEKERAKELQLTPGPKPKKVLFVGLGVMGAPMAAVINESGIPVVGYDVSLEAMDRYAKVGGTVTNDPASEVWDAVVVATNTSLQAEAAMGMVAQCEWLLAGGRTEVTSQHSHRGQRSSSAPRSRHRRRSDSTPWPKSTGRLWSMHPCPVDQAKQRRVIWHSWRQAQTQH